MPRRVRRSSSLTVAGSDESETLQSLTIVGDEEYAANFQDDYSEEPLSKQLEPIAVVGMGKD